MKFPKLEGRFVLAPMSGVSDVAFRVLAKRHGAAMTYTEFCSAEGLVRENSGTWRQAIIDDEEDPVGIQLFGSNIKTVQKAAEAVEKRASVIDFNLGCPAWHVLSQGCGSAMLAEPKKVQQLVEDVSSVLKKPFTVKLRLGLSHTQQNFIDVAKRCVDAGAVAVALHGRTTKQGYSGTADWQAIKELKQSLEVPVIGNGDIFSPEDAVRMLEETGCDYAMIGRAARNNPFIFQKANQLLTKGSYDEETTEERLDLFEAYRDLAIKHDLDFGRIKTHAMSLTKGLPASKAARVHLARAKTVDDINKQIAFLREKA